MSVWGFGHSDDNDWSQSLVFVRPPASYGLYILQQRGAWRPPTDVYETERYIVIKVEIAGMQRSDFRVNVAGRHIVISGQRQDLVEKRGYHNMEIQYGSFRSEIVLSWSPADSDLDASYGDGFLELRLPKAKKHRVDVRDRD